MWEKLVEAVLDREKLRKLALADSSSASSFRTSVSSSSLGTSYSSHFDVEFNSPYYGATTGNGVDISVQIQETLLVIEGADAAILFKKECVDLKHKAQQLELLLQQVAVFVSDILYYRPARRIMDDTHGVVRGALLVVTKCRGRTLRQRLFTKMTTAAIQNISSQLENCIRNVSWILRVDEYSMGGIPPIAAAEPILFQIWTLITILHMGSPDNQCNAATSIAYLLSDDDDLSFLNLFIEEEGVIPLSRILKEGTMEGREKAARALVWLVKDPKSICDIEDLFCSILEKGPTFVQESVVWGLSEITERGQFVESIVSHLAFSWAHSHEKELMLTISAKTLCDLIKLGNHTICRHILYSSALSHLAFLLEKGPTKSRHIFIMTLIEILEWAEKHDSFQSDC